MVTGINDTFLTSNVSGMTLTVAEALPFTSSDAVADTLFVNSPTSVVLKYTVRSATSSGASAVLKVHVKPSLVHK